MMLTLGLTGGIASGKSTVAAMFGEAGAALFNADRAVHALYAGRAAPLIAAAFPGTVTDGVVDRAALAAKIGGDRAALLKLEAIVHPLVHEEEAKVRAAAAAAGRRIIVLDIPLLFETGGEGRVDAVIVASAPLEVRKARALARPGMTVARFDALSARQMNEAEKRARAHFVIDTTGEFAETRKAVRDVLRAVAGMASGK